MILSNEFLANCQKKEKSYNSKEFTVSENKSIYKRGSIAGMDRAERGGRYSAAVIGKGNVYRLGGADTTNEY